MNRLLFPLALAFDLAYAYRSATRARRKNLPVRRWAVRGFLFGPLALLALARTTPKGQF